jgi:hypothetical protein
VYEKELAQQSVEFFVGVALLAHTMPFAPLIVDAQRQMQSVVGAVARSSATYG